MRRSETANITMRGGQHLVNDKGNADFKSVPGYLIGILSKTSQ